MINCFYNRLHVTFKFYDFFCRQHFMIRPCHSNLLYIMLQDNFRNLNRVILIQWKHLKSQVNAFWYCFKVIKRYTFHYLIKPVLILGNQSSFEILQLFVTWQVSPYYFLVLLWLWSKMNQMVFIFFSGTIQVLEERDLQLTRLSSIISPNL